MLRTATRLGAFAIILAAASNAYASSVADDTKGVSTLIEAYHQAVTHHDGERLAKLFELEGTAWFSVLSQDAWTRLRRTKPDAPKVRPGSVAGFVQMVSTSKSDLDPEHDRLHITSDGEVASVTFDFRFLIDGKEQNRGAESWQLIRTPDGWRIVSIVFSSAPPATPR